MDHTSTTCVLAFIASALGPPLQGQGAPRPEVRLPARVTLRCSSPISPQPPACATLVGTIAAIDRDSFTLRDMDAHLQRVAWSAVETFAVNRGSHGHVVPGLLGGALVGLAAGRNFFSQCNSGSDTGSPACYEIYSAIVAAGIVAGATIGALVRTPRWELIALPAQINGRLTRTLPQLALVVRVSW